MKKLKILVVDDDMSILNLYAAALEHRGFKVLTASCAEEGLALIEKELPDLVLTDIMMPQIHGLHFIDIIRSTPKTMHQKIMVLTALDDQTTKERATRAGVVDYIVKSQSSMSEVLDRITEALV